MISTAQKIKNLELAKRLWAERVEPEQVIHRLRAWSCGTQACFGGHLSTWPEFKAMGVANFDGLPTLITEDGMAYGGGEVARALFGEAGLFGVAGSMSTDHIGIKGDTDHFMVARRIQAQLNRLYKGSQDELKAAS